MQRFLSEWWLAQKVQRGDLLICFGNLPPLFHSRGSVVVFLQNYHLIGKTSLHQFPFTVRCRIWMERLWLVRFAKNVDLFIVQTPTMQQKLKEHISRPSMVISFAHQAGPIARQCLEILEPSENHYDFLYVASGEPHKNHINLIKAWCLLADIGEYPSLCLTVNPQIYPELWGWIETQIDQYELRVSNLGEIPHNSMRSLYQQSRALIFPSYCESLGLPLIEARQAGLSILASELDYVRDILDPEEGFDPHSAISISRAVQRFLGLHPQPLTLLDGNGFVDAVLLATKNLALIK
jgi:glycosyltransferase involved in cell wall biosynthesis